ncbi:DUF6283 family protein [bacterium]|nr:DUF6283 family protein [bacterium]
MNFNLKKPCDKCPFRKDVTPYITKGSAQEKLRGITQGDTTFTCHKTLDKNDKDQEHCGGALIFLEKIEMPNQMMRICERIGMYDYKELDMSQPVFENESDFIKHFNNQGD